MPKSPFPNYLNERKIGEIGINAVSSIVNDQFGWIFRRVNAEHDFGIDAYLDVVTDSGDVTGQSIAVQIKTGKSFFRETTNSTIAFYGEQKHLNYYLNLSVPVLIILYNESDKKCLWTTFDLRKTDPTKAGWKLNVSKKNILTAESKQDLIQLLNPITDHSSTIAKNWQLNEFLKSGDAIWYAVDRADVEAKNIYHLKDFIERIRMNETLCRKYAGRIELSISGYDQDPRELFEIEDVVEWFRRADPVFEQWFYFLDSKSEGHALKAYITCLSDTKRTSLPTSPGKIRVEIDNEKMLGIFRINFGRMNKFMDDLGMSIEENKRITFQVFDLMGVPHGD